MQGAHHSAQKSTSTGTADACSVASKLPSVSVRYLLGCHRLPSSSRVAARAGAVPPLSV
ncbi:MAG: hypothetical protein MZV64_72820 [Ignavibacteriales bacterium]|nr:hypothetical protein [Ignavibacteriales bacterium]